MKLNGNHIQVIPNEQVYKGKTRGKITKIL